MKTLFSTLVLSVFLSVASAANATTPLDTLIVERFISTAGSQSIAASSHIYTQRKLDEASCKAEAGALNAKQEAFRVGPITMYSVILAKCSTADYTVQY